MYLPVCSLMNTCKPILECFERRLVSSLKHLFFKLSSRDKKNWRIEYKECGERVCAGRGKRWCFLVCLDRLSLMLVLFRVVFFVMIVTSFYAFPLN